ncbi:hypothetical protein AMTR_s00111p00095600 [Amborella trichopoda]|uniref:F-box domain-containing protein n=1 Tax=Amborella trichopoda TaxID=13333 RepID=W1NZU1_AMBTC|nr:hypothetical protein AMTR_s00111p00095600 [Amborella trichopoda]
MITLFQNDVTPRVVSGKEIATIHVSVKLGKDRLSNVLPNELMEKILLLLPVKSIICFQSVVSYPLLRLLESTLSPAHLHYPIPLLSFSLWMTLFLSMDDCVMYLHDTDNELSCRKTKIRAPWVLPSLHSSLGSRTVVSNDILCIHF